MIPLVYALAMLLLLILFIKSLYINPQATTNKNNKKKLPPSPPKLPVIGNLHQLGPLIHRSLHSLSQKHGGPLMLIHMGSVPTLVVSSADAAREIMKSQDLIFSDRPNTVLFRRLLCDLKDVSVAPYGEYWRQVKSIMVLHLLSNKKIEAHRKVREEEIGIIVEEINKCCTLHGTLVDLSDMFSTFTNAVVCRVTFGKKYGEGEDKKRFRKMLGEFFAVLSGLKLEDLVPELAWVDRLRGFDVRVERIANQIHEFVDSVVEERILAVDGGDDGGEAFVDVLLKIQKDDARGVVLDKVVIRALVLDAYTAGTDTTTTVLEWAFSELLKHPRAFKKVQDEVRTILKGKQQINQKDIHNMKYLKAVLKETLRLHPPIPTLVPRVARQDVKVMGYDVAKGTTVITNVWAIGRDPRVWDDPNEFRPERFLECTIDFRGHDFELVPFGSGRRGCPGISFAMTTNEYMLANLLHKFDWELPNGVKEDDLDMSEQQDLITRRKVPLLVVAKPFIGLKTCT